MKKEQRKAVKATPKREIDMLIENYGAYRQHPSNKLIHWVCIPLILFSILGFLWSLPFPHLNFLGKFNGFLNWASFVIAFAGYYYYRLSPVLSYLMILVVFILAMFIVQLEKWAMIGGPAVWLVCCVIFIFAVAALLVGRKIEGKSPSPLEDVKSTLIGPIWLLHFLCLKMGLRY